MKKYKLVYGIPFALLMLEMSMVIAIAFLPSAIYISVIGNYNLFQVLGILFLGFIGLNLICIIIGVVINIFSKPFTEHKIEVYDSCFVYNKKVINYHEIKRLNYFNGTSTRSHSEPHSITILYGEYQYLQIQRPPLIFIYRLKKKCNNVLFTIDELNNIIFKQPLIGLVIGIIIMIIMIVSGE